MIRVELFGLGLGLGHSVFHHLARWAWRRSVSGQRESGFHVISLRRKLSEDVSDWVQKAVTCYRGGNGENWGDVKFARFAAF